MHTKRDHEGQVFQCKHCEYSSKARQLLKRHISVVHEGVKYNCDQCAYIVTSSKSLKRHMSENVHNVQACSQCHQLFDDPKRFVRLLFVCLLFCQPHFLLLVRHLCVYFFNPCSSLGETFVEARREETFPLRPMWRLLYNIEQPSATSDHSQHRLQEKRHSEFKWRKEWHDRWPQRNCI